MSDLTEKELLEWLRCLYVEGIETIQAEDDVDHEEAHDQLVKIVEEYFSVIETDMGKWLYRFYESWKGCSLGISDKEAEEAYAEICKRLEKSIADQEQGVDEEKKIEEIRMMIQKATSEYMPVYRRIYLNDAVEVEIRKLLARQPVQVDESSPMWKGELYKKYIPLFSRARSYVRTKTHLYHFVEEYTRRFLARQPQKRTVTREWLRETVRYLEMATDPISAEGALEDRLNELDIGVVTKK